MQEMEGMEEIRKETILSVSDLTEEVRDLLEGNIGEVCVQGEISNFRKQPSGHMYFTLKDEMSQVKAVMFRGDARTLNFQPDNGKEVVVEGMITVYAPRGDYQIRVQRMRVKGKGSLQERFEALKRKLLEEGLFDEERKKELPLFPRKIGIVTSPTGAALKDFLQIIERRCPRLEIQVFGVRVQGEEAPDEIVEALLELERRQEVDLIVMARGGGSLEDLWAFNEERVARAMTQVRIPIVSGVGHEIDFTICDFVADLRAPTPSAAAELVSIGDEEWREKLSGLRELMEKGLSHQLENRRWKLEKIKGHYAFKQPERMVEQWFQRVDDWEQRLKRALEGKVSFSKERMKHMMLRWKGLDPVKTIEEKRKILEMRQDQLRLLSPQSTLDRGYAIVFDEKRKVLKQTEAIRKSERVTLKVSDGEVDVTALEKRGKK